MSPRPETATPGEERGATAAALLELQGITKRFPGVVANDHVDLVVRPGEVHVLLGENGAGKSTLVGMLSGVLQPDEGVIRIDGRPQRIGSPRHALSLGIGTVFQHVMLVPSLTVADNLMLGGSWWRPPDRAALAREVEAIGRGFGLSVEFDAPVGSLSLGQQQQVEIVRALLRRSRVLLLDEATSMLTPKGIDELGALMRRIVAQGLAVVFITHKLGEACRFGDRITVLRQGRKVGEIGLERLRALSETEATAEIVRLMFGTAAAEPGNRGARQAALVDAPPMLRMRGLAVQRDGRAVVQSVDLDVACGEILGVAGIDGNGQKELAEALAGQRACSAGTIELDGQRLEALDVGARRRLGLRYVTDDRVSEGTLGAFPVATNLVLKEIGTSPFWRRGIERPGEIAAHAERLVADYDVRTPSVHTPVGRLSGGNIQKVLLARELVGGAKAIVFSKPTYGLDVQNITSSRRRICELAVDGLAVLLISTDLDELLELADRIAVMAGGRLAGTVPNDADARRRVGELMAGRRA